MDGVQIARYGATRLEASSRFSLVTSAASPWRPGSTAPDDRLGPRRPATTGVVTSAVGRRVDVTVLACLTSLERRLRHTGGASTDDLGAIRSSDRVVALDDSGSRCHTVDTDVRCLGHRTCPVVERRGSRPFFFAATREPAAIPGRRRLFVSRRELVRQKLSRHRLEFEPVARSRRSHSPCVRIRVLSLITAERCSPRNAGRARFEHTVGRAHFVAPTSLRFESCLPVHSRFAPLIRSFHGPGAI